MGEEEFMEFFEGSRKLRYWGDSAPEDDLPFSALPTSTNTRQSNGVETIK